MKNPALQRKNLYNKNEVEYSHKMAIYQGMAMVFVALEWHYGWKGKRLQRLFDNVQSIAEIPPIFGKAPEGSGCGIRCSFGIRMFVSFNLCC